MIQEILIGFDAVLYNCTGLVFVVLGVFVLIRVSGFPDLTVDGSFTIGAALYALLISSGYSVLIAFPAAFLAGTIGGSMTWTINGYLGVGKVVSSVLSMIIMILSAPYVSGGSTTSLLNAASMVNRLNSLDRTLSGMLLDQRSYQLHIVFSVTVFILVGLVALGVMIFLRSRVGLRLRYLGDAESPTLISAKEGRLLLLLGLACGNGLVAMGGAIESERRGGYTNNMGTGMLLVALAVLVLGEAIFKSLRKRPFLKLSEQFGAIAAGSLVYSTGIYLLLAFRLQVVDIRLLTALFLLMLLATAGRVHSSSRELF